MNMIVLQVIDSISHIESSSPSGVMGNVWFWIALAEFMIIILSTLIAWRDRNSRRETLSFEKGVATTEIDFSNIIGDSFLAPELYKKLMRACHPDRFTNIMKKEAAEELTLLISKNQYNVPELNRLGKIAEEKLDIKIL